MKFKTQIPISKTKHPVDHSAQIVSIGSCFAENMAIKLDYFKFQNSVNPFGVIFNPISIEKLVFRAVNDIFFTENDVFFHDHLWKCFDVHSDYSAEDKDQLLEILNQKLQNFKQQLTSATHIIFTFGTSWVYELDKNKNVVANCHKVAQNQFNKKIVSVQSIEKSILNTYKLISEINPNCQIIYTISPVRHLKDGFIENTQSKANLIVGLQSILQYNADRVVYFPSFEIMMDELRDYRFYADDLIHPSKMAVDYIWQRFAETYFSEKTLAITVQIDKINKALLHRPLHINSTTHTLFQANLKHKIDEFSLKNPTIAF